MKRVIIASSMKDLALGMEVLVGQTWDKLIQSIYDNTQFTVDSDYLETPAKFIYLYDPDKNEYEGEVTRYSNGQYELRIDNIAKITASTAIKVALNWDSFNDPIVDEMNELYLPRSGQGDNMASQIAVCVNKIVYRWFNDGDVFDNINIPLQGWANDLSSYANWLYDNVKEVHGILKSAFDVRSEDDYTQVLYDVYRATLCNETLMSKYAEMPKQGDVYNCPGLFEWSDELDEDEEDEYYWEDMYSEDEEDEEW